MSAWHRNHPEQYEEHGEPDWLGQADMIRKRRKEEPAEDSSFERTRDFREDQMWRDSEREQDRA